MKSTRGGRATALRHYFAAALRGPLAVLCALLLLTGSSLAQDRRPRPRPILEESSTTPQAPDLDETLTTVTPVDQNEARTPRPSPIQTVDGDIIFTSPGTFSYSRDIRLSDTYGTLRLYAADSLDASPAGASVQLFGNTAETFGGQLYLDSGAHNSAALIFRTAATGGALAERMRVRADGKVTIGQALGTPSSMLRVTGGSSAHGVIGQTNIENGVGVYGSTGGNNGSGVYGAAFSSGGVGVEGSDSGPGNGIGVYGETISDGGIAVMGLAAGLNSRAGVFQGNVQIFGNLAKSSGSFKIDHPLDPENKYLSHSFVESPDMMNIYNGNVMTDARGEVVVELPPYFSALNRDFRYQLTVIGQFAQAIVASEIKDNTFRIRTSKPEVRVSWQVTGIRRDAYAEMNRIPVEENKPARERGTYLNPEAFGQPAEKSVSRAGHTAPPVRPEEATGEQTNAAVRERRVNE